MDSFLKQDIYNNSVWNYRYFLMSTHFIKSKDDVFKEIEYVLQKLTLAIDNEAAWNYLNGFYLILFYSL